MLQIFLYGNKEQGWLDINPETALEIEAFSELFDEDLSSGDFSLPVELPWTNNNRRLMSFAERLENMNTNKNYWRVDVYEDGFPEMTNAKLTILEKAGSFSYLKGSFSASISGTKGLFGSMIRNKKMTALQLGGEITWTNKTCRKFAEDLMKGLYPQYQHIAFAPVVIENFFDGIDNNYVTSGGLTYPDIFLVKDTVNNIIRYGSGANDWGFGRPDPDNPNAFVTESDYSIRDYRSVPFLNFKFVIRKIFEEHGFSVTGDFIERIDFNDLFLFNTYSIEYFRSYLNQDITRAINPQNHVPDVLIKDFLKSSFDFFNIFARFTGRNEVLLIYRPAQLKLKSVAGISPYCIDNFTSTFENATENDGYTIEYNFDSADSYASDKVKDLKDKRMVATVSQFSNLAALDIGRQLTTDDIAFVEADNMYYVVEDATGDPIVWSVFSDGLHPYIKGAGERNVPLDMTPLSQYISVDGDTELYERGDKVAASQNGSYITRNGKRIHHDYGMRIFYIKKLNRGGVNVPVSFYHNRERDNTMIVPYSLALNGSDGMYKNFHETWQEIKARMEIIKTTIQIDQKIKSEIAGSNQVEINGTNFLLYKTEPTIPSRGSMAVQLVPL